MVYHNEVRKKIYLKLIWLLNVFGYSTHRLFWVGSETLADFRDIAFSETLPNVLNEVLIEN
jgi:hypothetical protein